MILEESFLTPLFLHKSVSGETLIKSLMSDLQTRSISPGHLYHTPVQCGLWHQVHLTHSPLRKSGGKSAPEYESFARKIAPLIMRKKIALTSMGCGDGFKDARIIQVWKKFFDSITYQPVDISPDLVRIAYEKCSKLRGIDIQPGIAANLSDSRFLHDLTLPSKNGYFRMALYLGINPNFHQTQFFSLLAKALHQFDGVIFSVNLAPGENYLKGVQKIFSQYDNPETRCWLTEFLSLIGVRIKKRALTFSIKKHQHPFVHYGICVNYTFPEQTTLDLYGKTFPFQEGQSLNLFNSFRHTIQTVEAFARLARLRIISQHIADDGQEALFFIKKKSA